MEIKATDVKTLREKTGAGMMDCKKALQEAGGDFAKAERILKELGLAAAQKRAGRAASEGRIFARIDGSRGVLLELSCETDFVAKNKDFVALGDKLSALILEKGPSMPREQLDAPIQEAVGRIKENMSLRRFSVLEASEKELLTSYIHGEGKIGVMVKVAVSDSALVGNPKAKEVAFDLALHTAAFAPLYLRREDVPAAYLQEQEEVFAKQAAGLGKPENVLKGITQGKLKKHLAEICFVDQGFVKEPSVTVAKHLEDVGKEIGGTLRVVDYRYYKVGEESE
ncbi:MAG: elongation factor Ts [Spirochaetales bacterium]|nr:elongation factor Ts [Spirochaetales bacterium]